MKFGIDTIRLWSHNGETRDVNFERGRIRPSGALDASAGVELRRTEKLKLSLQADVINLTDRLNVINFASLFSGTAIEPGRNVAFRLQTEF